MKDDSFLFLLDLVKPRSVALNLNEMQDHRKDYQDSTVNYTTYYKFMEFNYLPKTKCIKTYYRSNMYENS